MPKKEYDGLSEDIKFLIKELREIHDKIGDLSINMLYLYGDYSKNIQSYGHKLYDIGLLISGWIDGIIEDNNAD